MAKFQLKNPETFLPIAARGKGLKVRAVRTRGKQQDTEHPVPQGPGNGQGHIITVTDEREIRHLRADPRFTEVP